MVAFVTVVCDVGVGRCVGVGAVSGGVTEFCVITPASLPAFGA